MTSLITSCGYRCPPNHEVIISHNAHRSVCIHKDMTHKLSIVEVTLSLSTYSLVYDHIYQWCMRLCITLVRLWDQSAQSPACPVSHRNVHQQRSLFPKLQALALASCGGPNLAHRICSGAIDAALQWETCSRHRHAPQIANALP
jgi:hypothetical protein